MTNREFAKKDETFRDRCEMANVKPTGRQASRFINSTGMAFKVHKRFRKPLEPGQGGYYKKPVVAGAI